MTPYKETYKYPFIVTEILSCKNKLLEESLFTDDNILNLFKVLDNKEILGTTLPGYINKIITSHIDNELLYDKIFNDKNIIFDLLLKYVYNDYYRDLFYLIVNEPIKKGKSEYYDIINKIFELLLNIINQYISLDNASEKKNNLFEIKNAINNLLYIIIKLTQSSDDMFDLIIKKLSEGEIVKNILSKLKDVNINDENNEDINIIYKYNLNIFYCINKIMILFSNLLNNILSKNDNDVYSFNKYYLTTIIEPPYLSINSNTSINENESSETYNIEKNKNINIDDKYQVLIDFSVNTIQNIYSLFKNKIETIPNINKSNILSIYNIITDILILLLIIVKKENENISNLLNEILLNLIKLIIDFPSCSLIHNKTLKIFQLNIEYNIAFNKDNIINFLKNYFNEKRMNDLITNEGIILNDKKESSNNIYLINILNLIEKQENKKVIDYLSKTNAGLFENEKLEPGEYVPKPDEEEIIFQKKQDIHDSEGFIFTPKKTIETSKKIMKNLKEFDK